MQKICNLIDDVSLQINELYTALYGIELDNGQSTGSRMTEED